MLKACLTSLLLLSSVAAYSLEKIIYFNNPNRNAPWTLKESGKPPYKGVMLQLLSKVVEAEGTELEVINLPSNRAISNFKDNNDTPWVTWSIRGLVTLLDERFDFHSSMSIDVAPFNCLHMIHKSNQWENFAPDLSDARLIIPGHMQNQEVNALLGTQSFKRVSAPNPLALFKLLIKKRGDVVITGPEALNYAAHNMSFECSEIKTKSCNIPALDSHVFLYSDNVPPATIERYNRSIAALIEAGEFTRIIKRVAPPACANASPPY